MQRTSIVAGDTFHDVVALPTYPAGAGWVLHYRLVPEASGGTAIELTGTAQGDEHLLAATAAATAAWVPGLYSRTSWVARSGEVYSIASDVIELKPDPRSVAAGFDGRTAARKALDAANEALVAYGHKAWTQAYTIGNRAMTFRSPAEFLAWRSALQAEVQREENAAGMAAGLGSRRKVLVRLPRA